MSIILLLVVLALFFIVVDLPLAAGLCLLAAFFIATARAGKKTVRAGKAAGSAVGAGVREDVAKAEGAAPDTGVFREGVENAGDLTAQQLHAPDKYKFKYKGVGAVGEACSRLINSFKRLFG